MIINLQYFNGMKILTLFHNHLMNITISRKKSISQKIPSKDNDQLSQLAELSNLQCETRESKDLRLLRHESASKIIQCSSNDWLLGKCMKDQQHYSSASLSDPVFLLSDPPKPQRHQSCYQNRNSSSNSRSKLKVTGCRDKSKDHERAYPESLNRLKQLKVQELMDIKNQRMQQKVNQILNTKRYTGTQPSPSLSKNSSSKIIINTPAQFSSLNSSNSGKRINLTLTKKNNIRSTNTEQNMTTSMKKPALLEPEDFKAKKQSFLGSEAVRSVNDRRSHFHSSSNQLKITDPLDELKSQNTQYLKKRLVFSWVKSDKEEDLLDKLNVPMLTIRQSNSEYQLQNGKKNHKIHKSMALVNNELPNQYIKEPRLISGQSVVVMKGAEDIFELSSSSYKHCLTGENAKVKLTDSVIEHTEVADEENLWYHTK